MLTVLEAINLSTIYLQNKGVESPRINAELLLACILKCRRLDLYLSFDRPLQQKEIEEYRSFVKRRSKREPLQYITGVVEFYGIEFKVSPAVLIPRPETEILVEAVINSINSVQEYKILDIGTGSGIIPIVLAKKFPQLKIAAIDISDEALKIARENSSHNNVDEKILFYKKDILNEEGFDNRYDIIISNPPYISESDFNNLEPELKDYEPKSSLTDFGDGLNFYRVIISKAKCLLNKKGKIFFEIGKDQAGKVKEILVENNFTGIIVKKDYQNIDRVISGDLT
jgi:release factor glutamine methyltransferase